MIRKEVKILFQFKKTIFIIFLLINILKYQINNRITITFFFFKLKLLNI